MIKINGYLMIDESPNAVLGAIFSIPKDLKYWSVDGLRKFYIAAHELVCELCEERKRDKRKYKNPAQFSRFISTSVARITYLPKDREQMLVKIYDAILLSYRLGHLSGFGMTNRFGDKLQGNPERQTLK
jgi:hypothetical protein